jgi:hypothetical protein
MMIVIMTMVYFGCFTCNNCALDVITKNIPATGVKVSEFVLVRGFLPPPHYLLSYRSSTSSVRCLLWLLPPL